jgi:hypothetical protein
MLATPLSGGAHRPAIDGGLGSKEIKIWRALQRPSRAGALAGGGSGISPLPENPVETGSLNLGGGWGDAPINPR